MDIVAMCNQADKTVADAVSLCLPEISHAVDLVVQQLQNGGRLFYIGAGTSGRIGVLDAAECPPTFNTPKELVQALMAGGAAAVFEAVEGAEDDPQMGGLDLQNHGVSQRDVIIGISASGRTPYVRGALQYARSVQAKTIALSCNKGAEISEWANVPIEVLTGPEVLMGSTRLKAGTAQKMVLNMISTATMVKLGKVYRNLMVDLKASNEKLVERSKRIVMQAAQCSYESAQRALAEAQGDVKAAILMLERGLHREHAQSILMEASGVLREALRISRSR